MPNPFTERMNKILDENLSLLDDETASLSERRIAQLYDRARLILQTGELLDSEDKADDFSELFRDEPTNDPADAQSGQKTDLFFSLQTLSDKITVCSFLAEELKRRRRFPMIRLLGNYSDEILSGDLPVDGSPMTLSYLQNAYSDRAFRRFDQILSDRHLTVSYADEHSAACEDVYYGRADFCILPLDSSRDAKLIGFYRLINKYGLKIMLTCDITSSDGVTTRYALLEKHLELPRKGLADLADASYFEFSFLPDEKASLADLLTAAKAYGLTLYQLNAIPLAYSDGEFTYDVLLRTDGREIEPFALFLALTVPQFDVIGMYPHFADHDQDE